MIFDIICDPEEIMERIVDAVDLYDSGVFKTRVAPLTKPD
jgi:hypothetical protein